MLWSMFLQEFCAVSWGIMSLPHLGYYMFLSCNHGKNNSTDCCWSAPLVHLTSALHGCVQSSLVMGSLVVEVDLSEFWATRNFPFTYKSWCGEAACSLLPSKNDALNSFQTLLWFFWHLLCMVVLDLHLGGLLGCRWTCQSSELQEVPLLLANPDVNLLALCC